MHLLTARAAAPSAPLPQLEAPVAVIGDIHGRADLLEVLLARLGARSDASALRVICVGDMLDRGPDSLQVLRRLHALSAAPGPFAGVLCLKGNHEQMMLDFLEDPVCHGPRWLVHGGAETLESVGLSPNRRAPDQDAQARLEVLRDGLQTALGGDLISWVRALGVMWREDMLAVTHAAMQPQRSPDDQPENVLLWGDARFLREGRRDGVWVAHGHTIYDQPQVVDSRISVDTGAWRTGRLTAAVLAGGNITFEIATI